MITINQELYNKMPEEVRVCFNKLPNQSSEEVRECFPETKSGKVLPHHNDMRGDGHQSNCYGVYKANHSERGFGDSGNASRFFKSIIYQAKASKSERNKGCEGLDKESKGMNFGGELSGKGKPVNIGMNKNYHPTVKPIALMEYLIKMVTPKGGTVLDPFMGSGTTGIASKNLNRSFIGVELDAEYFQIAESRIESETKNKQDELFNETN